MEKIVGTLPWVPTIFKKCPLFIYNKLNKLQIKLLWVFINYNKVLGSNKNKKFLNLSDPLILKIITINKLLEQITNKRKSTVFLNINI